MLRWWAGAAPFDSTNDEWWLTPLYPDPCGPFVGLPDPPLVEELAAFVSVDQVVADGGFAACPGVLVQECGERWTLLACGDANFSDDAWTAMVRDRTEVWYYVYRTPTDECFRHVGTYPSDLIPCETDAVLLDTMP